MNAVLKVGWKLNQTKLSLCLALARNMNMVLQIHKQDVIGVFRWNKLTSLPRSSWC